jgi:hypothetical protein
MNRSDRRRRHAVPPLVDLVSTAYRCPDCISRNSDPWHDGRIWQFAVMHDDSCPTLAAIEKGYPH